jgi:hypothetical protein
MFGLVERFIGAKILETSEEYWLDDLIALVGAADGILQAQAGADAAYFAQASSRTLGEGEQVRVETGFLRAYRWQYILSGVELPRFGGIVGEMVDTAQHSRIAAAEELEVRAAARARKIMPTVECKVLTRSVRAMEGGMPSVASNWGLSTRRRDCRA